MKIKIINTYSILNDQKSSKYELHLFLNFNYSC